MKTICIMNLKGGVGKTVTADNMAAILAAKHQKRTLIIDADHQGNTSKFYKADQDSTTLREILLGDHEAFWDHNTQLTEYSGLDIIPANMNLAELDAGNGFAYTTLRDFLECVAEDDGYDFVIIDMPPAFSTAAKAALLAADEVIIPINLDAFSVDGMAELLRQIGLMRKLNPGLRLAGVLITMWRGTKVYRQAEELLRTRGGVPVYKTVIRRTERVVESTFNREPLHKYDPSSTAAIDYDAFVAEYLGGGSENG